MEIPLEWFRFRGSSTRQQELHLLGVLAELPPGAPLDLAHAFLRDPQLHTDLTQRLLACTSDPEATDEDPPLARVEPPEQARDDSLPLILGAPLLARVGAGVGGVP